MDDDGIHLRNENILLKFIPWDELERLQRRGAQGKNGTKISFQGKKSQARDIHKMASEIWKNRCPDAWQRNADWINRRANWIMDYLFLVSVN